MSIDTLERVDLDVDLTLVVPCDSEQATSVHGNGEPATHRAVIICQCGSTREGMVGALCIDYIRRRPAHAYVCDWCGADMYLYTTRFTAL